MLLGDDAFPLKTYLMKPYSYKHQTEQQRIASYRISRARRTVENAFSIMYNRFRFFLATIRLEPSKVEKIVLACTALHNMLRRNNSDVYCPPGSIDSENQHTGAVSGGIWRKHPQLQGLQRIGRRAANEAKDVQVQTVHGVF